MSRGKGRRISVLVIVAMALLSALATAGVGRAGAREVGSYNWAGYAVRGPTFAAVVLEFVVPEVTCTADDQAMSVWAGFGGLQEQSLVQAGVQARCSGTTPRYELFQQFTTGTGSSTEGPVVSPGDTVRVVICPAAGTTATGACTSKPAAAATNFLTAVSVRTLGSTTFQVWSDSLVPRPFVNTRQEAACIVERPRDATSNTILDPPNFTAPTLRCQPYRSISPPPTRVDIANGGSGYAAYRLSIVSPLSADTISTTSRTERRGNSSGPGGRGASVTLGPPPVNAGPDTRSQLTHPIDQPRLVPTGADLHLSLAHLPVRRLDNPATPQTIGEDR